jgi:hypothetical protein
MHPFYVPWKLERDSKGNDTHLFVKGVKR